MTASGPKPSRFRVVFEVDVEITDPITVAATSNDWGTDGDEIVMMNFPVEEQAARLLVMRMMERREDGVRVMGASTLKRERGDDGNYLPMTLAPMPIQLPGE